jgi:hypothetical protein
MTWLRLMVALSFAACVDAQVADDNDMDMATVDTTTPTAGKGDTPGWEPAATLHADTSLSDFASAGSRRVHSIWVSGSNNNRVPLTISAHTNDDSDVRIAVLGPLQNGARAVLAADGYSSRKRAVSVSLDVAQPGEHLVIVGSYNLATDTSYELSAACTGAGCGVSRVDALATPKDGALVGDTSRLVSMVLGDALVGYGDVEVEVWAAPPMQSWAGQRLGVSEASGNQVNAIVPASVQPGDDLRLVVREAGEGRILDTGVTTRFAPQPSAFARLDSVIYSDLAGVQIAGVVGFFEGVADMRLYSETLHREIARDRLDVTRPGQVGNGLNAFDATFLPELSLAAHDGELLSVGYINGNGDYRRLGCFEYCNNLSGLSSCTGGPRACPL